MRIRVIAMAALLAVGLVGCANSNLAVFDRPQVDADLIENAVDSKLDPNSTRLLWDGTKHDQLSEGDERNNRLIFVAQHADRADTTCLIVANSAATWAYAMTCSSGGVLELGIGPERYRYVANEIFDEADGWERLADGLWRELTG